MSEPWKQHQKPWERYAGNKKPVKKQVPKTKNNLAENFNREYGVPGVPEEYSGLAHGIDQGLLLGAGDEATAAGAATVAKAASLFRDAPVDWKVAYRKALAARRQQRDDYRNQNKIKAFGSEVAGGLGSILAGGGLVKAAKTLPQAMGRLAGEGAIYGGLNSYASADKDRGKEALTGATVGSVVGGLTPALSSAGSGIVNYIKNKIASRVGSPDKQAYSRIQAAMGNKSRDEIQGELLNLGDEAMVVDALGHPGHALARSSANTSPFAREILENASKGRMAGQGDRLNASLKKASGIDEAYSTKELQDIIRKSSRPEINKAYQQAREAGYDINMDDFADLFESEMVQRAAHAGNRLAQERSILDKVPVSPFSVLDGTKQALDDIATPAFGKNPTNRQAIAAQYAKRLREQVDNSLPEYGGARQKAKDLFDKERAIQYGADLAKPYSDDLLRRIETSPQKGYVGQGYAAAKMNQVNNRRNTSGGIEALFGTANQKKAMQTALGENAGQLEKQLHAERIFGETHRALTGNSTTARQLAEMGITAGGAGLGLLSGGDLQSAGAGALAAMAARRGGVALARHLTAKQEAAIAPIVAEILAGKELPQEIVNQVKSSPEFRNAITRALIVASGD